MMHILVPACGSSSYFADSYWPKNVIEVLGKPMIQYAIESFETIEDKRYIFILNQKECDRFHTDNIVEILAKENADIIKLSGDTKGALCTSLMAVQYINDEEEIIICNNDQKFDCDLLPAIEYFRENDADAGVVCFDCVHPRWSYVRMDRDIVVEAAEKRPISRHAIAGVYYFRHGRDFIEAAKNAIVKGREQEGLYFTSASLNEMILLGKKVMQYSIENKNYHTFYSPEKIKAYERDSKNE